MGTSEQNKALVVRFLDALDAGDIATAAACFDAERYYSHWYDADLAGTWEKQKAEFRSPSWTDVLVESLALVADGDRVAYHSNVTGTHSGPFFGIPASGVRLTISSLQIWRIADDLIVEHWGGLHVTEALLERLRGR